jgi:hypothetical protein
VTAYDLSVDLLGLGRATHPTVRNLAHDLASVPFFFGSLVRHRAFVAFALKTVVRQSGLSLLSLNHVRSIMRRLGAYEMSKRYGRNRIVLLDEGPVLSAHLLFVFSDNAYSEEEISKFASLVPLPELVVYIKAPVDIMVQRLLQRSDAPRELRSKDQAEIEGCLWRAARVFDQLAGEEKIWDRVLVLANASSMGSELGVVADGITAIILNRASAGSQVCTLPAGQVGPVPVIGEEGFR